jgi:molybdopterin molybdotransferase
MITLEQARQRIDEAVERLPVTPVRLRQAVGCRVGQNVVAPINVPNFSSSAMDGVAVRSSDLEGEGPWRLPIQAVIAAGQLNQDTLLPGRAVKIMTGAPLMREADTVVPIEDVTVQSGNVLIKERPPTGQFVRPLGDDIVTGELLFREGDVLGPVDVGVLASIGVTEVEAVPSPRIVIISTGAEVVEPGRELGPGQIYDSNVTVLENLLACDGLHASVQSRALPDDTDDLRVKIQECLNNYDVIVSTGGVSMGDFDFVPDAVRGLGGKILFHKVAVKPGKPVLVAQLGNCWFMGLPGNPVSVVAGYHLFVRRVVSRLAGVRSGPRSTWALLADDLKIKGNRECLVGARVEETESGAIVHPVMRQKSGRLSSIRGVNSFIITDGGSRTIPKGNKVYVEWIS